jgi:hypothetical protein
LKRRVTEIAFDGAQAFPLRQFLRHFVISSWCSRMRLDDRNTDPNDWSGSGLYDNDIWSPIAE